MCHMDRMEIEAAKLLQRNCCSCSSKKGFLSQASLISQWSPKFHVQFLLSCTDVSRIESLNAVKGLGPQRSNCGNTLVALWGPSEEIRVALARAEVLSPGAAGQEGHPCAGARGNKAFSILRLSLL